MEALQNVIGSFRKFLEEKKLELCTDKIKVLICNRRGREKMEIWK